MMGTDDDDTASEEGAAQVCSWPTHTKATLPCWVLLNICYLHLKLCSRWQSYWHIPSISYFCVLQYILLDTVTYVQQGEGSLYLLLVSVYILVWSGYIQYPLGCTAATPSQLLQQRILPGSYLIFEVYFAGPVEKTGSWGLTQALAQHVAQPRMYLPALNVSSYGKISPSTTHG